MTRTVSSSTNPGARAVTDRLVDLIAVETRIVDLLDRWRDTVRDHPEAADTIEQMRTMAKLHHAALERRLTATPERHRPRASEPDLILVPSPSASDTLRRAAEAAFAAAFAYEAAYEIARLSYDGDTCDLLETHLTDYGATVVNARRALPHTVARELRRRGVTCVCRCPMCSIGACGCVRNTLATVELAWGGQEPGRAAGLTMLTPPRPGSQLAEAGLEEGDRVLAVDGEEVGANQEMQDALCRAEVGGAVRLDVERRSGERTQLTVHRVG